jgi:hypothetical protein
MRKATSRTFCLPGQKVGGLKNIWLPAGGKVGKILKSELKNMNALPMTSDTADSI